MEGQWVFGLDESLGFLMEAASVLWLCVKSPDAHQFPTERKYLYSYKGISAADIHYFFSLTV